MQRARRRGARANVYPGLPRAGIERKGDHQLVVTKATSNHFGGGATYRPLDWRDRIDRPELRVVHPRTQRRISKVVSQQKELIHFIVKGRQVVARNPVRGDGNRDRRRGRVGRTATPPRLSRLHTGSWKQTPQDRRAA